MPSHTYHNTGNFTGSTVFQGSKLVNVGEIIGSKISCATAERDELQALVSQLRRELEALPAEYVEAANAVATRTEKLVGEAAEADSDPATVSTVGKRLKDAAGRIADVAPKVLDISNRIVDLLVKAQGLTG